MNNEVGLDAIRQRIHDLIVVEHSVGVELVLEKVVDALHALAQRCFWQLVASLALAVRADDQDRGFWRERVDGGEPALKVLDLIQRPLDSGDILSNANTIILMGKTRDGLKMGRALYVAKHRGSACSEQVVPYEIGERGLRLLENPGLH